MARLSGMKRVVSGGQTGVDRAALDWALRVGLPHGGWCPKGRRAEDGVIPERYALRETASTHYEERTYLNVRDSDGTLVLNSGALDGGTLLTTRYCGQLSKPFLVIDLDRGDRDRQAKEFARWSSENSIEVINIAGPRESKRTGIHRRALEWLNAAYKDG